MRHLQVLHSPLTRPCGELGTQVNAAQQSSREGIRHRGIVAVTNTSAADKNSNTSLTEAETAVLYLHDVQRASS